MKKHIFCAICLAVAAVLLLSGCEMTGRPPFREETSEPAPPRVSNQAEPPEPSATAPAPTLTPAAFPAAPMELDITYTFGETRYTLTCEYGDDSDWPITRLLAEEDNGWDSAVTFEGQLMSAYYCETEQGPCILVTVDFIIEHADTVYVLNASTLAEGDSRGGYISGLNDGVITISGYVDMLGTYAAKRDYTLGEYFALEPTGEGLFHITEPDDIYITTLKNLPVQLYEDGQLKSAVLSAGTQLCVTATDGSALVYFKTSDGRAGVIQITLPEAEYWEPLIEGAPAEEWFEELPYSG